jgi:hypothetical protein
LGADDARPTSGGGYCDSGCKGKRGGNGSLTTQKLAGERTGDKEVLVMEIDDGGFRAQAGRGSVQRRETDSWHKEGIVSDKRNREERREAGKNFTGGNCSRQPAMSWRWSSKGRQHKDGVVRA